MVSAMITLAGAADDLLEPSENDDIGLAQDILGAALGGDPSLELRAHNVLGNYLGRRKAFAPAHKAFERAFALLPTADGTTPEVLLRGNFAQLTVREAEAASGPALRPAIEQAHRAVDAALTKARVDRSPDAELRAHYNLGLLQALEGDSERALSCYSAALEIATRLRNRTQTANIRIKTGDATVALGREEEAVSSYEAAVSLADEIRPAIQVCQALMRLSRLLPRIGQTARAQEVESLLQLEQELYDRELDQARRMFDRVWEDVRSAIGRAAA
jgi:tetratricopeptide (TPR) repeat protein